MNLDELRSVQSKERQKDSLQQLRDSFYQDVAAYIADLRAERDRRAEQVDNPFSDDEVRRLSDELDTAEEVAEALYERRVGKVVKLASFAAADMSAGEEGLTVEEQELFDDLVDRIKQNKASVLDVLAGEGDATGGKSSSTTTDTDTSSPATAAPEPTADGEPTTIGGANADHAPSKAAETPEQPPPEQAADDGMLADAMGAPTERGGASDGTAADNPARRAADDTNTAEGPTETTHNDTERTDGESGIPTTDGGSTTAATPTSKSTPSAESTPTSESPSTNSTPTAGSTSTTESTPTTESASTAPSQPSSASTPADDGSTEATMATPETATGSTESATQSAESVTRSAESVTQSPASATEPTGDHDHPTDQSTADAGTEASNTEAVSTDTAHSESIDRTTVRITESVGAILGVDEREYILTREDVVTLPTANAEALLSQDAAIKLG